MLFKTFYNYKNIILLHKKHFTVPFLNYNPFIKLQLRVFLAGHGNNDNNLFTDDSKGSCLDTMIVASSDKEWL